MNKQLYLLLITYFLTVGCADRSSSKDIDKEILYEQNPMVFIKSFITHVRGVPNKNIYFEFLHSSIRDDFNNEDKIALIMFKNAFVENDLLFNNEVQRFYKQ